MDYWILAAAGISALLFLAHVNGGGKEVHLPMLESNMSQLLKAYTSVIWHAISAVLAIGTGALLWAAMGRGDGMAIVIVVQYLAFVGLFLLYGIKRLKSIWVMPQWVAFLIISVCAGIGLWN
jgi:hypothetical protein